MTDASVSASDSVFPIGTTTMSDDAKAPPGNHTSCSVTVHVKGAAEQLIAVATQIRAVIDR